MPPSRRHHQRRNAGSGIGPWLVCAVVLVPVIAVAVFIMTRGGGEPQPVKGAAAASPSAVTPQVETADEPPVPDHDLASPAEDELTASASLSEQPESAKPSKGEDDALGFDDIKPVAVAEPVATATRRPPRRSATAGGRSPLLQVGEFLEHPIPPRRLDDGPPHSTSPIPAPAPGDRPPAPKPGEIVPWTEARQHVGRTITVGGKVVLTNNTGSVCFLNFVTDWRGRFYVIILKDALNAWPQPPQDLFLNKTIAVTGEVKLRDGTPQIQVRRGDQIRIVEGTGK